MTKRTTRKNALGDTLEPSTDHSVREYDLRDEERLEELEPQRNPEPELDEAVDEDVDERQVEPEPDEERVVLVGRLKLEVLPIRPPLRCASASGAKSVASTTNSAAARGARIRDENDRRPMRTRSAQRARAGEYRNGTQGASPVISATNRNNSSNESQPSSASTQGLERLRCEHHDDQTRPR